MLNLLLKNVEANSISEAVTSCWPTRAHTHTHTQCSPM